MASLLFHNFTACAACGRKTVATPAAGLQNRPEPALLRCVKGGRMAGWAMRESRLCVRAGMAMAAACGTPDWPKDPPRIMLQSLF